MYTLKNNPTLSVSTGQIFLRTKISPLQNPSGIITSMNDLYNETITRNGKTYHYDPDMDCYYCRHGISTHWDDWAWVYVIVVLSAIAYYAEYMR